VCQVLVFYAISPAHGEQFVWPHSLIYLGLIVVSAALLVAFTHTASPSDFKHLPTERTPLSGGASQLLLGVAATAFEFLVPCAMCCLTAIVGFMFLPSPTNHPTLLRAH